MDEETRLWMVTADHHDYDEYDAFVIRAVSAERALEVAQERASNFNNASVEAINSDGSEEIVLGSFNAG